MTGRADAASADAGPADAALAIDWLSVCRRAAARAHTALERYPLYADRAVSAGIGIGGDLALVIDRVAEDAVFHELEALDVALTAISEERGEVLIGSGENAVRAVIDPIDGSLNARRTIPSHSLSIALATGDSIADVELGYVYDFGAEEEFLAVRGGGSRLNGRTIRAVGPGYGLEVVGIESARPERVVRVAQALSGEAFRIRSVGSIAITLCYVAAGRFDGMLTARPCRSVDLAAAQLIVCEAGAVVEIGGLEPAAAGLGLDQRYHVAAAHDAEGLEPLLDAQRRVDALEPG